MACLLGAEHRWEAPAPLADRAVTRIDLPRPHRAERARAWKTALRHAGLTAPPLIAEVPALAAIAEDIVPAASCGQLVLPADDVCRLAQVRVGS